MDDPPGGDATNHAYGPDYQFAGGIRWRFILGHGKNGLHLSSPGMDRKTAIEGARRHARGDLAGARGVWGMEVCAWLDEREPLAKQGLYAAAMEIGRAFSEQSASLT